MGASFKIAFKGVKIFVPPKREKIDNKVIKTKFINYIMLFLFRQGKNAAETTKEVCSVNGH